MLQRSFMKVDFHNALQRLALPQLSSADFPADCLVLMTTGFVQMPSIAFGMPPFTNGAIRVFFYSFSER